MHPEVSCAAMPSQWYYIQETDPTEHRNTSEQAEQGQKQNAGRNKMHAKTEWVPKEREHGQSGSGRELAVVASPMFRDWGVP